uniref:Secreted RxLR effector protein 135 n=1 Tax=Plasmopara viticola TaxID=143451 RepID=RL135_PLAVT|nr:RecName: Full=Secreted RxLR effector protein 135; Flags: Precursor [Plasmopara viticola]
MRRLYLFVLILATFLTTSHGIVDASQDFQHLRRGLQEEAGEDEERIKLSGFKLPKSFGKRFKQKLSTKTKAFATRAASRMFQKKKGPLYGKYYKNAGKPKRQTPQIAATGPAKPKVQSPEEAAAVPGPYGQSLEYRVAQKVPLREREAFNPAKLSKINEMIPV